MHNLSYSELIVLLSSVADAMIAAKDELTALDAALGDGDLGRTVDRGFRAIQEALPALAAGEVDAGKALYKVGKIFADSAASSFGALLGTAFMKSGMALKGKTEVSSADLVAGSQAAFEGIVERGKAQVGDKTMLDALHPALQAMRAASASADAPPTMAQLLRGAATAAQAGAEQTKGMQSQAGRASWQGERSVGQMDGGARAVALMFEAAADYMEQV